MRQERLAGRLLPTAGCPPAGQRSPPSGDCCRTKRLAATDGYRQSVPWLIVLGDRDAIDWVVANGRMAVSDKVRTLPEPGERVALYTTRGAYRNPTRDRSQIIGLGRVTGKAVRRDINVAGKTYAASFPIGIDAITESRQGLPFEPLVEHLTFITTKRTWGGALRRPLVRIPDADFKQIERRFMAHHRTSIASPAAKRAGAPRST